jgi:hypothetical protein
MQEQNNEIKRKLNELALDVVSTDPSLRKRLKIIMKDKIAGAIIDMGSSMARGDTDGMQKTWDEYEDDFEPRAILAMIKFHIKHFNGKEGEVMLKQFLAKLDPDNDKDRLTYSVLKQCIDIGNWRALEILLQHHTFTREIKEQKKQDEPLVFVALERRNLYCMVILFLSDPEYFNQKCTSYATDTSLDLYQLVNLMREDGILELDETIVDEHGFEFLFSNYKKDDHSDTDMIFSLARKFNTEETSAVLKEFRKTME